MKRDIRDYKIRIGGSWDLEDLYIFPRNYEQIYFLIYSLIPKEKEKIQNKIEKAYSKLPWQGGYSTVSFYNQLKKITPTDERPIIISINYSSPGWVEVRLINSIALAIERIVKSIATTIECANHTYHLIHRGMHERELLRIKIKREELELEEKELLIQQKRLELERAHAEFIEESAEQMARLLGFKALEKMHKQTGSPLKTLKILLSLYRRVRVLAYFQKEGKINL